MLEENNLEERCEHCTRKACMFSLEYFAELVKQEQARGNDYTKELEKIKAECIYRREK